MCNWADLFPWLATSYLNAIEDTGSAETAIKFRMMQQDFLTLSRIYYCAANAGLALVEGIDHFDAEPGCLPADLTQIADSFTAEYQYLAALKIAPEQYSQEAANAFHRLGEGARGIYEMWDQIKFLRSAELGLGVLRYVGSLAYSASVTPYNTEVIPDTWTTVPVTQCSFRPDLQNYSAFAKFYKVMPLILPTSKRIVALGPGGLLLCPTTNIDFCRSSGAIWLNQIAHNAVPLEFKPNLQTNVLESKASAVVKVDGTYQSPDKAVCLYPIPYFAAQGISWKGQSFSTNVGADEFLLSKLQSLAAELEKPSMTTWSYSTDNLPQDWTGSDIYQRASLPKHYFGIVPEPQGAF